MTEETILEEAIRVTSGDRRRDYGHPYKNHQRIAWLWNAYLRCKGHEAGITPEDAAFMMGMTKVARHIETPKRDNLVDLAGYANCVRLINETEAAHRNGVNVRQQIVPEGGEESEEAFPAGLQGDYPAL